MRTTPQSFQAYDKVRITDVIDSQRKRYVGMEGEVLWGGKDYNEYSGKFIPMYRVWIQSECQMLLVTGWEVEALG